MGDERKPLLVILDGHGIIHRAYHALRDQPLTVRRTGEPVGAVYGFANTLLSVLRGAEAHPRGRRARPAGPHLSTREGRDLQGAPGGGAGGPAPAGRPLRGSRRGLQDPHRSRRRLRGRRRARHPGPQGVGAGSRDLPCDSGQRHRAARAARRPRLHVPPLPARHRHLRRAVGPRALRHRAGPDAGPQGAQGRRLRQHPRRARHRREDGGQARAAVRERGEPLRAPGRGAAREAAGEPAPARSAGPSQQEHGDHRDRCPDRPGPGGLRAEAAGPREGAPASSRSWSSAAWWDASRPGWLGNSRRPRPSSRWRRRRRTTAPSTARRIWRSWPAAWPAPAPSPSTRRRRG